jgi:molecular chaperone HtpG
MLEAAGQTLPAAKPWLELNAAHPLIARLGELPDGDAFSSLAAIVADPATLAVGGTLADPAGFLRRLNDWLLK